MLVSCLPNLICLALAIAEFQRVLKGSKLFPHYITAVKFPLQTTTLIDHQLIAHTMEKFHENFKESEKQVFAFRCRGGGGIIKYLNDDNRPHPVCDKRASLSAGSGAGNEPEAATMHWLHPATSLTPPPAPASPPVIPRHVVGILRNKIFMPFS